MAIPKALRICCSKSCCASQTLKTLFSQVAHLVAGFLLLHVLQHLVRLLHAVRRLLGIGRGLRGVLLASGRGIAHGAFRLLQLPHGLLELTGLALAEAVLIAGETLLSLLLPSLLGMPGHC